MLQSKGIILKSIIHIKNQEFQGFLGLIISDHHASAVPAPTRVSPAPFAMLLLSGYHDV